jgi:hypothetical protein
MSRRRWWTIIESGHRGDRHFFIGNGKTKLRKLAMRFHYGYFVLIPSGHPMPAGDDWGPSLDTYKPGDSLGVKNGKEGIVVAVAKVGTGKRSGFDVLVLIVEYDHADTARSVPRREVIEAAFRSLMIEQRSGPRSNLCGRRRTSGRSRFGTNSMSAREAKHSTNS